MEEDCKWLVRFVTKEDIDARDHTITAKSLNVIIRGDVLRYKTLS